MTRETLDKLEELLSEVPEGMFSVNIWSQKDYEWQRVEFNTGVEIASRFYLGYTRLDSTQLQALLSRRDKIAISVGYLEIVPQLERRCGIAGSHTVTIDDHIYHFYWLD